MCTVIWPDWDWPSLPPTPPAPPSAPAPSERPDETPVSHPDASAPQDAPYLRRRRSVDSLNARSA